MAVGARSLDDVTSVLAGYHGRPIDDLVSLCGGYWSAAYAYSVDGQELVARFGADRSGYDLDRAAMAYARPGLPVPEVLDIVAVDDGWLAVSVRHHGTFLEDLAVGDALAAAPSIERMLTALRVTPAPADWPSWRDWLRAGLVDDPVAVVSGWRARMTGDVEGLFVAACDLIERVLPDIPERRDLVHGDLLHQNVLVDDGEVTAVFSWKCSTFGDFLFDAAWCEFWSPWHSGIEALDIVDRVRRTSAAEDLVDVDQRLNCYLTHIGATHLAWTTWTGDAATRAEVAARLAWALGR
jgi:aminoglycoside phosphotransferase (APT) family kinase protein